MPDVDFVVYTEDRAHLAKSRHPRRTGPNHVLPFALGFARSDDHWDVGVPDPSFFGWPELAINPHWQIAAGWRAFLKSTPFDARLPKVHWRGGLKRSGGLREAMVGCAKHSKFPAWMDVAGHGAKLGGGKGAWEHPLAAGRFKLGLFIQV